MNEHTLSGRLVQKGLNRRTKTLILSVLIFALIFAALLAGLTMGEERFAVDFANARQAPSLSHPFGTDWLGRDLFARTLKGLSISLTVGFVASVVSAVFAVLIGIVSAMGSKRLDGAVNWLIDLVMGVPHLVLIILISFACGKGLKGLLVGVALTHWTSLARLIRAEVLQLRGEPYIAVSRMMGNI